MRHALAGTFVCSHLSPLPQVFAQLQRNVLLNACVDVVCLNLAVSEYPRPALLYAFPGSANQDSLRPLAPSATRSTPVTVTTVDMFSRDRDLDRLDILKIGAEENELAVLNGARESLLRVQPLIIVEISLHQPSCGYTGATIKPVLNDPGFECFRIETDGCKPYESNENEITKTWSHFNVVAVPRARAGEFFALSTGKLFKS